MNEGHTLQKSQPGKGWKEAERVESGAPGGPPKRRNSRKWWGLAAGPPAFVEGYLRGRFSERYRIHLSLCYK